MVLFGVRRVSAMTRTSEIKHLWAKNRGRRTNHDRPAPVQRLKRQGVVQKIVTFEAGLKPIYGGFTDRYAGQPAHGGKQMSRDPYCGHH